MKQLVLIATLFAALAVGACSTVVNPFYPDNGPDYAAAKHVKK